jgi:carbon starvation protein
MTILPIILVCAAVLTVAYLTYGPLISRWLGVDGARSTPACDINDGNDYVPAAAPVVLGGHFTAIAAAGPVVGPILAGLAFGWLPALLWIMVGAIFIGGVHDASALMASIRHRAASITQVVREHMTPAAYVTFLMFVWISLIYVIIAFADVTASSFAKLQTFDVVTDGVRQTMVLNGGAVVVGATAYLVLSIVFGLLLRFTKTPWWVLLPLAVVGMGLVIHFAPALAAGLTAAGWVFMDTTGATPALSRGWNMALLVYCFVASVTPMWLLLQPRGLIGATFLYATLVFGAVGTLVGGFAAGSLTIQWPAFKGFVDSGGNWLFPFLFITIACGACSGFHSIVASGTTSKQIRSEKDVKAVGYGSMLLEAMVAIFALSCVMVLAPGTKTGSPDAVYAQGIGNFMNLLGIDLRFAIAFGLLAFSSFVFDTLDVCTRLGRYVLQEMLGLKGVAGGAAATVITLAAPAVYLWNSEPGSFRTFWTIFGTSNQLLAALTLVGVSVWLWRTGRPVWFALVPACFMLATTATALVMNLQTFSAQISQNKAGAMTNAAIAVVLLLLAGLVVFEAVRVYVMSRRAVRG